MMPRIPLIEDLTREAVPEGSNLLVEFDPTSQWYSASISIMAGWIRTGGKVAYNVAAQPPEKIRLRLKSLGLVPEQLEKTGSLRLFDWYTATLGQKSTELFFQDSLKVADMSIQFAKQQVPGPPIPEFLGIMDNASVQARFNDEKAWIEFALTRAIPSSYTRKSTSIDGVLRGVHSEWAYTQLEAAYDGVIDLRLVDEGESTEDLIRIRSMRDVSHDRDWHELKIGSNFEVTVQSK
jgi:KaiC/GvpD/RAD55 family RecA-like ATPase